MDCKDNSDNPKKQNNDGFNAVAGKTNKKGHPFTPQQYQGKMKNFQAKYIQIKDCNNTSGNDQKSWEYFDVMAQYYDGRPSVEPKASCSSLQLASASEKSSATSNKTTPEADLSRPKKKRRLQTNSGDTMLKWLEKYSNREYMYVSGDGL